MSALGVLPSLWPPVRAPRRPGTALNPPAMETARIDQAQRPVLTALEAVSAREVHAQ